MRRRTWDGVNRKIHELRAPPRFAIGHHAGEEHAMTEALSDGLGEVSQKVLSTADLNVLRGAIACAASEAEAMTPLMGPIQKRLRNHVLPTGSTTRQCREHLTLRQSTSGQRYSLAISAVRAAAGL